MPGNIQRAAFFFPMKVRDAVVSGSLRCFHTELATALGINAALVFERLRYLFEFEGNGKMIRGHRWLFNSYPQWQTNHFPWMCERSVQYAFRTLEQRGMVVSIQPDGSSRRKYYRISESAMEVDISHDAKSASWKTQNLPLPNTGIDVTDINMSKESPIPSEDLVNAVEIQKVKTPKPSPHSKQLWTAGGGNPLVSALPLKANVESFIQEHCPRISDHRPDIYDETDWSKVRYWKTYLTSLDLKMESAIKKAKP